MDWLTKCGSVLGLPLNILGAIIVAAAQIRADLNERVN
jgi:hypothetical protein